ncbi:MAG: hypothetical protein ACUVRJ_03570 [Candidatus Villigracilaceae bacterium]
MKKFVFLIVLGAVLLSACGPATPPPTPTMSIADIQATSVSMVWTMVAQTQAAMPTATPLPTETPTPLPTSTPLPSPTVSSLLVVNTPTTAASTGGDPCNGPLTSWVGQSGRLAIVNQTGGKVTVTVFIKSNRGGECGYKTFQLGNSVIFDRPELMCFSVYAWVTAKKKTYTLERYGLCTNNADKYTVTLMEKDIKFEGP